MPIPTLSGRLGIRLRLLAEPRLEVDRSPDRLACGREHGEPFVASNLDQDAAVGLDTVCDELDELGSEPCSRLVPVFLGEAGVAAHIGDEERAYACLFFGHDPVSMPPPVRRCQRKEELSADLRPGSCRSGSGARPVAATSVS